MWPDSHEKDSPRDNECDVHTHSVVIQKHDYEHPILLYRVTERRNRSLKITTALPENS